MSVCTVCGCAVWLPCAGAVYACVVPRKVSGSGGLGEACIIGVGVKYVSGVCSCTL